MRKIITLFLIILLHTSSFALQKAEKEVLFISSYNASFPSFFNQLDGVRDVLDNDYVLDIETMDSKRFFDQEYFDTFTSLLKYKYENRRKPDAVIVADDNAYNFLLEKNDELFKDTPVVFIGVNTVENAVKADQIKNITGFVEKFSLKETIDIAAKLIPDHQRLVVIVDDTTTGRGQLKNFEDIKHLYAEDMEIEYILLKELDFSEYRERLKELDEKDIVLLFSAVLDKNGTRINFNDVMEILNENIDIPVFHLWRYGVGDGLLGGKLVSHYDYGVDAANLVRDVLEGRVRIEDLKVKTESENEYFFDYQELMEHNLDPAVLPESTRFINKPASRDELFEKYQDIIIPYLLIFFTLLILIVILLLNIQERKKKAKEIKVLAFYDKLSGLPNRVSLMKELESEYFSKKTGALLSFDIDNFKNINDVYGHSIGDRVLKELSGSLQKNIGKDNFLAKTAGDEFVIILRNCTEKVLVIEYLKGLLGKIKDKIEFDNHSFYITFSIGIAVYPADGRNVEELFMNADMALYKAKEFGKNTSVFFVDSFNKGLKNKLEMQNELISALDNNELYLCYQPKYLINDNEIINYEALLRWRSPKLGEVSPEVFIRSAEEMGLIHEIGKFVLEESCRFIKYMEAEGYKAGVSVNVSTNELNRHNYVEEVLECLSRHEIDPKQLGLEITETVLITNFVMTKALLEKMKLSGVKILLDDFGKGYSSLNYIRNLPIDTLKIDKTFIDRILDSEEDRVMVKSIIEIAHINGMNVIAEGVEKEEQLKILRALGCDAVQGYLIARPMRRADVLKTIRYIIDSREKETG